MVNKVKQLKLEKSRFGLVGFREGVFPASLYLALRDNLKNAFEQTGDTLRNSSGGTTWVTTNNLYNNGTNVGIGMQTPGARLNVADTFRVGTTAQAGLDFAIGSGDLYLGGAGAQAGNLIIKNASGTTTIQINSDNPSTFGTDVLVQGQQVCRANVAIPGCPAGGALPAGTSGQTLRYDATNTLVANSNIFNNPTTNYVGIGTALPGEKLEISGGRLKVTGASGGSIKISGAEDPGVTQGLRITDGAAGTGLAVNGRPLRLNWDAVAPADTYFSTGSGVTAMTLQGSTGNVGIGTTAPGAKLEINGQIKITGGSPGANKVLTSDASGLASWQTGGAGGVAESSKFCTAPQVLQAFDVNVVGSKTCVTPSGGGTVTAGTGLTGGGALPTTLSLANPVKTCTVAGQYMTSFDLSGSGSPTCSTPAGTGNGVTGSGSIDRVTKWTSSGTNLGDSSIYQSGTNIGINTGPSITLAIGDNDTGLQWWGDGQLDLYTNNGGRVQVRDSQVTVTNDLYVGTQRVCRADGTGCPRWTFGGIWTYNDSASPPTCMAANPFTGGCSCPSGFTSVKSWIVTNTGNESVNWCYK